MKKTKGAGRAIPLLIAVAVLTACGSEGPRDTGARPNKGSGDPTRACASGGGSAVISWVDFIRQDGVTYDANSYEKALDEEMVGESVAEVRCKIADNVTDPEYDIRDGDAAYLSPGTMIHRVDGYPSTYRLTAKRDGKWVLYEPDYMPEAESGADLLAIEGRVDYIGINSSTNGTRELARIDDPGEVEQLVEMVMSAPVDQDRNFTDADLEDQVFIEFGLADGTRSIRAFGPDTGQLARGIMTPPEFAEAVEQVLQQRP